MSDPLAPEADKLHELLQRTYRRKRRLWALKIGRPYSEDLEKPEPAVLDGVDPENG